MQDIIPAPSTYSRLKRDTSPIPTSPIYQSSPEKAHTPEKPYTWRQKQLNFKGVPIYSPREGRVGDDVTLYYPEFQKFIDDCESVTLKRNDLTFVEDLCTIISESYKQEIERQNKFEELIKSYFLTSDVVSQGKSIPDIYINPCSCVMIEVKNEVGQGGGDSHSQLIAYYVHSLTTEELSQAVKRSTTKELAKTGGLKPANWCPAPAFLLELVGPHLFISGAMYGKYVFVDRLVDPVWLVPQREEAMIRIARIFKALKRAIGEIRQYYQNVPKSQPRFPIFQSFYKGNIEYEEAIKRHTFKGTLIYHDETIADVDVVVMFAKKYSRETHELMAFHKYAPKLIHYEERVGGTQYTAIVMGYIPDARPLDEFLEYATKYDNFNEIKEYARTHCTKALKVMHDNGFCHGKISSKSIIGTVQGNDVQIFIVNYKWAGIQGEARYTLSADIPEGVQPGYPITREQDKDQLEKLLPDDNESEDEDE